MLGNCCVAERLAASEEGLSSVEYLLWFLESTGPYSLVQRFRIADHETLRLKAILNWLFFVSKATVPAQEYLPSL
jgi:hypothetical protein